jgi:alpha-beta hydrolase superfamily lysophospholipase
MMNRLLPVLGASIALLAVTTASAQPEIVQITTDDGVMLHARYYPAQGQTTSAAVYLHQPGRSSEDWDYMAAKMAEKGVAGVAPDLRGHGESLSRRNGDDVDRETFESEDFYAMVQDVQAAVGFLRKTKKLNGTPIQLVGADVGGSAALLYAVQDSSIETLALLSPGLMYDSVDIVGKVAAYGSRPLLMVVSVEDSYSVKSTDVLAKEARGVFHQQTYFGVGHGTKMLNREPDLEQLLGAWLNGTFKTAEDRSTGLADGSDQLAEEQRARAERELSTEEDQEKSKKDSAVQGADDGPTRWD